MGKNEVIDNTMEVVKRDGRHLNFEPEKIYDALRKASDEVFPMSPVQEVKLEHLTDKIVATIFDRFDKDIKIYEIQNIVEHVLLDANEYQLAEVYINYRTKRDFERSQATDINFTIDKLINKEQSVVNENANKDSDVFNTQRDLTAGIVGKSIGLKMLPAHVANAHQKGDIHFHDLDYQPYAPMTNCCLVDVKGMLRDGFKLGNAVIDSPKSIQTAAAQISQIIANVASSQYGGTSVNRIDEVLAPYAELNYAKHMKDAEEWVAAEKREDYARAKTAKDIYDAMQSLEYEINTLFTSNGQTPFTTFGFGLGEDWYAREIQKAILQTALKVWVKKGVQLSSLNLFLPLNVV
jgi:ribonucleoside-triphosphate reductase